MILVACASDKKVTHRSNSHRAAEHLPSADAAALARYDDQLSQRFIALDPAGYFLIRVDAEAGEIVAEHYCNNIDAWGRAVDPISGEVLSCRNNAQHAPTITFRGRSAKELGIQLTEGAQAHPLSRLDHAFYLGRELQKAEACLISGCCYEQD